MEKIGATNPNGTVGSTPTNSSSTRKGKSFFHFSLATLRTQIKMSDDFLGCLWTLSPAKATKMDEEVLKWSRKDPSAIKRAMAYPGMDF